MTMEKNMGFVENLLNKEARRKTILWTAIILVLALFFLMIFNFLFSGNTNYSYMLNWSDPTKYQAVFLSNGQVYFGRVVDINKETLILEDIYYLRASKALQTGVDETRIESDNFSLIKLGSEIHGPEDNMKINLDHVMFVEDLSWESKVVEAIREYKVK